MCQGIKYFSGFCKCNSRGEPPVNPENIQSYVYISQRVRSQQIRPKVQGALELSLAPYIIQKRMFICVRIHDKSGLVLLRWEKLGELSSTGVSRWQYFIVLWGQGTGSLSSKGRENEDADLCFVRRAKSTQGDGCDHFIGG